MRREQIQHGNTRRYSVRFLIMAAALIASVLASLCIGRLGVPLIEVLRILVSRPLELLGVHMEKTWTDAMLSAVINIRLPRVLMACMVGCSLSAAGAAYQGVFSNPMASPDILGASSGAAFGAAVAILAGASSAMIIVCAFVSSLITVGIVYFIGRIAPGQRKMNLILAGIMVSSLFSAGTSYVKLVADPSNQLPQITYWLMGSLSGVRSSDLLTAVIPMAAGLIPLFILRWRINLLTLGDEQARTMGVNADALRLIVIACATLMTAASISVAGMIGWVGLVIPHLSRKLAGENYKILMPACMLLGAAFLLIVDDISRNLLATEIPIGILTAFVGAPFFVYLITRKERSL